MAKRHRVTKESWDKYKRLISNFVDEDAGRQKITWLRRIRQPLPFGEDEGEQYKPEIVEGLLQYNFIRTWPSIQETITGELDGINIALYLTKRKLAESGFLNQYGYWDLDWVQDRFLINGKVYSPAGDTEVAQAADDPLLFLVVLKRETPEESIKVLKYIQNLDKYLRLSQSIVTLGEFNGYEDINQLETNSDFKVEPKQN